MRDPGALQEIRIFFLSGICDYVFELFKEMDLTQIKGMPLRFLFPGNSPKNNSMGSFHLTLKQELFEI